MQKIFLYIALLFLLFLSACQRPPDVPATAESTSAPQPPPMPEQTPAAAEGEPASSPAATEIPAYNDYIISLDIDPSTREINGVERVIFTNRTGVGLDTVVFRVYINAFKKDFKPVPYVPDLEKFIFLNGKDYARMDIRNVTVEGIDAGYNLKETVLTVTLPETLLPEETVQIGLQFEAYVPQIAHRTGANENAMWCGMFLPVLAVYDKGGWRTDPYYPTGDPFILETANYTVDITAPPEYAVVGSGVKKEEVFEDKKVTTFSAKMIRDFAFAVSDKYQIAEIAATSGVTVQFYYYTKDANVDGVLDAAKRSMEYFESAVGTYPFPNGHVCIVETDMYVTGVDFSKVIFMDSGRLTGGDYYSLTHYLGHQWFSNVVGNDQINEAWLDEGLTLYIQERFSHETDEEFFKKMDNDYNLYVVTEGQKLSDGLESYKNSQDDYYTVQSTKGKLMFYALNRLMGNEKFKQCIQKYYQSYSFKIASGTDFITIAEEVYGGGTGQGSLKDFFDEWLNGENLPKL